MNYEALSCLHVLLIQLRLFLCDFDTIKATNIFNLKLHGVNTYYDVRIST